MCEYSQRHVDTAIVNDMASDAVEELLTLAEAAGIEIVGAPETGLSMMHALDAFDCEFLLGEILVTRVEVEFEGRSAFAMVLGDEPERALARACLDLLFRSDDQLLRSRTLKLMEQEQKLLIERRCEEERMIAGTRVNFELMAGN